MYLGDMPSRRYRMLKKEDFAMIKALDQHGVYIKDIAAELGVHPKTVSHVLKRWEAPNRERKRRNIT
jgi:IS30 family transposase